MNEPSVWDLPARWRRRIVVPADTLCWLWQGYRGPEGYVVLRPPAAIYGRVPTRSAHRLVYEMLRGPIPEGMTLDHTCMVTFCLNPAHLEPETLGENSRLGHLRDPNRSHPKQSKGRCGHPITERSGVRRCWTCRDSYIIKRRNT